MDYLTALERLSCGRDELAAHGQALPGDRRNWAPDRQFDTRHIRLDLTLDVATKSVAGTATHHIVPFANDLTAARFDAVDFTIEAVTVDARPAAFDYDGRVLSVALTTPGARGRDRKVAVTYRTTPRLGLFFVGPDDAYPDKPSQAWTQGQDDDSRYWFPCVDHPSGRQTTEILATVPGTWSVLSNGRLLEDKKLKDGRRRVHWFQERPHPVYLVTLVAGEFMVIDDSRDGLQIDYWVEPAEVEKAARTFGRTPDMVALFAKLTGTPYPWPKYSQVVVRDFVLGGMENTSATTMIESLLLDKSAEGEHDPDLLVSHELAHQWFGNLVTCREWSHGWLNEGFATFMEFVWLEHHRGLDHYREAVLDNTKAYLDEPHRRPIVSNVWNAPVDIFDRHLYEKGGLVLHTLRRLLGDDAFWRSVQRYLRENQDRTVLTHHLSEAIFAETGRDLEWFFDQWVYRPGHPRLRVEWTWDEASKAAKVTVEQIHDFVNGAVEAFRLPVTIDFRSGRGRPRAFGVEVNQRRQSFVFALPERPDLCRFDPGNTFLKELDFPKPVREHVLQLQTDDDIAGRIAAARALGVVGGPEALAALEAALAKDRFWGVQAAAARALERFPDADGRDALLRNAGHRNPKVRRAVAEALGVHRGDRAAYEALIAFVKRDRSLFVRAEALKSLGRLRLPEAFDVLVGTIGHRSWRETVRVGCIDGLVELRDPRGVDVIARAAEYGQPAAARRFAVAGLGRLAEHVPEAREVIAERVLPHLRDPDFRVRIAAANALRSAGDRSHAEELDAMAAREIDGRPIRAARMAAMALRQGDQGGGDVASLRDDVEKLRAENERLRDRVAALESRQPIPDSEGRNGPSSNRG